MSTDNFTKFPNDVLDGIVAHRFSAAQMTALLYISRKVYGWGKYNDLISISSIARETGFSRRAMISAVHDLEVKGVLKIKINANGRLNLMQINNPKMWDDVNPTSHQDEKCDVKYTSQGCEVSFTSDVNSTSHQPVKPASHTKESKRHYKDTFQKKEPSARFLEEEGDAGTEPDDDDEGWYDA